MKDRLLFVTNRNILTTCGELRLIKNRAETMYMCYGIPTDFIVMADSKRICAEEKEEIFAGGDTFVIRQSLGEPATIISAVNQLIQELKKRVGEKKYKAIIFSGSGMPYFAKYIKKIDSNLKTYADIHGASEDIIELQKKASFYKKIIKSAVYILDKFGIRDSVKYLDGYFVVTASLKQYIEKNYNIPSTSNFYIAPCATTETKENYFENYRSFRDEYRKKYEISEETTLFIYSGGVSPWQCIEETLSLYERIHEKLPNSKFLVFSHHKEAICELVGNNEDIVVDSYQPDELTKVLCAGDFAFLLRKDCITNNVAFPNKFLEYVQSKMKIIATPYVYEIAKQIEMYDLGFLYSFDDNIDKLIKFIQVSQHNPDLTVRKVLEHNRFETRLESFCSDYK